MNIKGYLMWAKDYGLRWDQLCNMAFCLGVTHDQLVEGVLDMKSPALSWISQLYMAGVINKKLHQNYLDRKRVLNTENKSNGQKT